MEPELKSVRGGGGLCHEGEPVAVSDRVKCAFIKVRHFVGLFVRVTSSGVSWWVGRLID